MMMSALRAAAMCFAVLVVTSAPASAQAVGGADQARPVAGDPGISSMVVIDKTAKLTGYLGVRDTRHGTIGIDHLFGG